MSIKSRTIVPQVSNTLEVTLRNRWIANLLKQSITKKEASKVWKKKILDVAQRDLNFNYSAPLTSKDGNILSCLELFCVDGCMSPPCSFKNSLWLVLLRWTSVLWGPIHHPPQVSIIMGSASMDSGSSLLPHYRCQQFFSFSSLFSMSYFLLSFLFPVGSTHLGLAQKQCFIHLV